MKQVKITPLPLKVRFAKEIGTRISLRIYWGDGCSGRMSCHNAMLKLRDEIHPLVLGDREHKGGKVEDYPDEMWPKVCEDCGLPVPGPETGIKTNRQVFNKRLYDTEDGTVNQQGVIFYAHWMPKDMWFDNQIGDHIVAVCPGGEQWTITSRASNCTMKEDRLHRCWCVHGSPEDGTIHVDKNGHTCNAGAGSIQTSSYHGFLRDGYFV